MDGLVRILLVEEDSEVRKTLSRTLTELGHYVYDVSGHRRTQQPAVRFGHV